MWKEFLRILLECFDEASRALRRHSKGLVRRVVTVCFGRGDAKQESQLVKLRRKIKSKKIRSFIVDALESAEKYIRRLETEAEDADFHRGYLAEYG